jgi:hypothetical protein
MIQRALFAVLSLLLLRSVATAETFTVKLKVVDSKHKPVAGAQAAPFWHVKDGAMNSLPDRQSVTDASGRAALEMERSRVARRPVLVLTADRKLGGIVGVGETDEGKELTVVLGPTVHVKAKFECGELKLRPQCTETRVIPDGFQVYCASHIAGDALGLSFGSPAVFELVLPCGKYTFETSSRELELAKQMATLRADRLEYDFGTIDMKPTALARMKGKPAPDWIITDARGARRDVKLSDYRGKWVYLEFWGYW